MSNPRNYAIELPRRCLQLIDALWDVAAKTFEESQSDLGPLTSTFLLSMSMPILNLPIERVEKKIDLGEKDFYIDDRYINEHAVEEFKHTIRNGKLGDAPFYRTGAWSFYQHNTTTINMARELPEEVAVELDKPDAIKRAESMPASQWISVLRNALAHGGVLYLNSSGRSVHDDSVAMFAFVSGKFNRRQCRYLADKGCYGLEDTPTALRILRITEHEYRLFLRQWVSWLLETEIAGRS